MQHIVATNVVLKIVVKNRPCNITLKHVDVQTFVRNYFVLIVLCYSNCYPVKLDKTLLFVFLNIAVMPRSTNPGQYNLSLQPTQRSILVERISGSV